MKVAKNHKVLLGLVVHFLFAIFMEKFHKANMGIMVCLDGQSDEKAFTSLFEMAHRLSNSWFFLIT